ncbi:hypothetical protein PTKIN_Ptkin13bG0192000 [Pterospermum kingtungense]
MAKSNRYWPADMLPEILLKLPVKSIIRFKCVSKTWCILFKNPTFVSQHFSLSKKKKYLLVDYYDANNEKKHTLHLFVYETLVPYHDLSHHLPSHLTDSDTGLTFCVDNGLFCLLNPNDSRLTLWNPATRKSRILPECNNQNFPPILHGCVNISLRNLGFGLDPLSNDYKVIYIRSFFDRESKRSRRHYAVYRMRTDSWRVLEEEDVHFFEDVHISPNTNTTCANGVYYWQVFKIHYIGFAEYKVLAFHLSTEVFQLMESPLSTCGKLVPLHDGRISIWDIMGIYHERSVEIWVLNDECNWTKLLKIEPPLEVEMIFEFWKNGKVFAESEGGQLLLYDLHTKQLTDFGIKASEDRGLEVYTYEETLVDIGRE